jgi:hypothetical protein
MQTGSGTLPLAAMAALGEYGFVVLHGAFPVEQLGALVFRPRGIDVHPRGGLL